MGNVIQRRIRLFQWIIGILFVIALGIGFYYGLREINRFRLDERKIRIDCNTLVYQLEQNPYQVNTDYSYCVIGLDGTVICSTMKEYVQGDGINLHTLGMVKESDGEYRIPLSSKGEQFGTAIIKLDKKKYQKNMALPKSILYGISLVLVLVFTGTMIGINRFVKADIVAPLGQIHKTTNAIMQGNLDVTVQYDYDGEIGGLCHDFELMRNEIKDYIEREKIYKKKETLLLASISHDLKTPLATVGNYAEGILYEVVETKEDIKEYSQIILNKINYLNGLIDDILEHAKTGLNQFKIEKVDVYAKGFFESLLNDLKNDAAKKGVQLSYEEFPNVVVNLDPMRITQVLQNLVDNSIKYGKTCGTIVIKNQIRKEQLLIQVIDNGQGISSSDLPYIFDEFYRGDKARNQQIPGSGLGLNIAKYIIEKHDGEIECESIVTQGTTMSFTLKL